MYPPCLYLPAVNEQWRVVLFMIFLHLRDEVEQRGHVPWNISIWPFGVVELIEKSLSLCFALDKKRCAKHKANKSNYKPF